MLKLIYEIIIIIIWNFTNDYINGTGKRGLVMSLFISLQLYV